MPTISVFFGIVVSIYMEKGSRHKVPHLHARFGEDEIVVSLNGEILEGRLPKAKLKLLLAWMTIHEEDLYADWDLINSGREAFKIEALK